MKYLIKYEYENWFYSTQLMIMSLMLIFLLLHLLSNNISLAFLLLEHVSAALELKI